MLEGPRHTFSKWLSVHQVMEIPRLFNLSMEKALEFVSSGYICHFRYGKSIHYGNNRCKSVPHETAQPLDIFLLLYKIGKNDLCSVLDFLLKSIGLHTWQTVKNCLERFIEIARRQIKEKPSNKTPDDNSFFPEPTLYQTEGEEIKQESTLFDLIRAIIFHGHRSSACEVLTGMTKNNRTDSSVSAKTEECGQKICYESWSHWLNSSFTVNNVTETSLHSHTDKTCKTEIKSKIKDSEPVLDMSHYYRIVTYVCLGSVELVLTVQSQEDFDVLKDLEFDLSKCRNVNMFQKREFKTRNVRQEYLRRKEIHRCQMKREGVDNICNHIHILIEDKKERFHIGHHNLSSCLWKDQYEVLNIFCCVLENKDKNGEARLNEEIKTPHTRCDRGEHLLCLPLCRPSKSEDTEKLDSSHTIAVNGLETSSPECNLKKTSPVRTLVRNVETHVAQGKDDEITRLKVLINNGLAVLGVHGLEEIVKVSDDTSTSDFAFKNLKTKLSNRKRIFINPLGFFPCKESIDLKVNMLQVHGIPWRHYQRETMRLASFSGYPTSAVKSPSLLASAGFVYIGDGVNDRVKCYFCSAEKENWQQSDDIDEVHMELDPHCPIVLVQSSNNVASSNVASNISSLQFGSSAETSSAEPCDYSSHAQTVGNSMADESLADLDMSSRNSYHDYDEVDSFPRETSNTTTSDMTHSRDPSQRSFSSSGLNTSQNQQATLYNQSSSTRDQVQQHGYDINQHAERRHHTNINSQIYSIPSELSNTPSSTMRGNEGTSQNMIMTPESNSTIPQGTPAVSTSTPESSQGSHQLTYQMLGIFHDIPKHPEFAVVARRQLSFENWQIDHPIRVEDLVKSGLYYAGYGDCCRCFFCGGGLRNWESEDDPFVEHARWFWKCGYIIQLMGQDFVAAVQVLKTNGGTITFRDVAEYMKSKGQHLESLFDESMITDDPAVKSLIEEGYTPETVIRAALSLRRSGEILSADIILQKIREDNPGATAAAALTESTFDEGNLRTLKEQNYTLRNNFMCKICMDKEVKIVFLPCGHLVSCPECAIALQDCPVCRKHIRARVRANIH